MEQWTSSSLHPTFSSTLRQNFKHGQKCKLSPFTIILIFPPLGISPNLHLGRPGRVTIFTTITSRHPAPRYLSYNGLPLRGLSPLQSYDLTTRVPKPHGPSTFQDKGRKRLFLDASLNPQATLSNFAIIVSLSRHSYRFYLPARCEPRQLPISRPSGAARSAQIRFSCRRSLPPSHHVHRRQRIELLLASPSLSALSQFGARLEPWLKTSRSPANTCDGHSLTVSQRYIGLALAMSSALAIGMFPVLVIFGVLVLILLFRNQFCHHEEGACVSRRLALENSKILRVADLSHIMHLQRAHN